MLKKFLIFFLFFSIYFSQNIITSWNYDKVAMYDLQKINTFLSSFTEKPFDIPITIKNDTLTIDNIKLTQIQPNLYDSLINYNTGLLLFSPNKITFCFDFSYNEEKKGYKDNATLELRIMDFKIKVKNDKDISKKADFSVKMSTDIENYSIPGIEDKEFLKVLQNVLYYEFNKNLVLSKTIAVKLETGLNDYYNKFYETHEEFKVQTNEFFGSMIFPMRNNKFLYFCEDHLDEYKTSFCYYKGYTSLDDDQKDKTKVPLVNERFSHNDDDLYNIFINKDMFQSISDYIVNHYLNFNPKYYNNETHIKELSYDFTVESLQKYFKGLDNIKKENIFDCEIYIENITLFETIYRVKININDENKNNFQMKIHSEINIDLPIIKSVKFNMCLKEIKSKNIEIISSTIEPQVEIKDLDGLKKVIEESFDFEHIPICLSDDGISLRDYFSKIIKIYVQEEGIYFEGKQLYQ